MSAADFAPGARVDHPFFPLTPGSTWSYEAMEDGEIERITVTVLDETRTIMGVGATVVRDTVTDEDGELVEDTHDWYAQDKAGNVWYLGEESLEYEDGRLVGRSGSWEWGQDGALPGVIMPAVAIAGSPAYYQEHLAGEAVDQAEVVALGETIRIPLGEYTDTLRIHEWNPLESDSDEYAVYARGIGAIKKWHVEDEAAAEILVAFTAGPG